MSVAQAKSVQRVVYDKKDANRRALIAKVKMGQKALAIVEDDYRAMLLRETGCASAADCTEAQLIRMVEALKRAGWQPDVWRKPGRAPSSPASTTKTARKARALWISLHQLGVVHNPTEIALEAFAKRQLKVERLQWANDGQMYRLIEALKAMAERAGWSQSTEGVAVSQVPKSLKLRLCERLRGLLVEEGLVPAEMRLGEVAWKLLGLADERGVGPMLWSAEALDVLAKGLAAKRTRPVAPVSESAT